ncbi:MAG: hypothetical protein DRJ42_23045 [Deltaproteobacteria bacterium]|nr:MAG: hypothetical protein DRJ42_23045 [Deltaproteobacteria bacterium]
MVLLTCLGAVACTEASTPGADAGDASPGDAGSEDADAGTTPPPPGPDSGPTDAASDARPPVDTGTEPPFPDPNRCLAYEPTNQLIGDRHFQRGFIDVEPTTSAERTTMVAGLCPGAPIWQIAFGNSPSTLYAQPRETLPSGAVQWSDSYAHLAVGPQRSAEADFVLGMNGRALYGGAYYVPRAMQGWVFHLAQQQISIPGDYSSGSPAISSLRGLDFSVFGQLIAASQNRGAGYDPDVHAAQYLIYFTVQNQNGSSPGFGDYLWFGVTLYDDRTPVPGLSVLQDRGGTERLIYNLGAAPFVSRAFTPGGPGMVFAGDLLPGMRDALRRAWANGFLTGSNDLSDYRIGGMNIGWEASGLNDVEMRVKDLSLVYERRPSAPVVFGFDTDGDREGWTLTNGTETAAGPRDGSWGFTVPGATPMLESPELAIEAATHPVVRVVVANDGNPAPSSILKVYWDRFGDEGLREAWSRSATVSNGGGFQTIEFDMSSTPGWVGEIRHLRVDPILAGDGHSVAIDEIAILPAP